MSALLLTGIFSSCEKKQSELTLDDMKGVAKVTGTVKYNQGATVQSDGSVIYDMTVPAVGQTVIVSVPNIINTYCYKSIKLSWVNTIVCGFLLLYTPNKYLSGMCYVIRRRF